MKLIYFYRKVLFPYCVTTHIVGKKNSFKTGDIVAVWSVEKISDIIFPKNKIVTIAAIQSIKTENEKCIIELKGQYWGRITKRKRFYNCTSSKISETILENEEYITNIIRKKAQEFVFLININESEKLIYLMNFITKSNELIDFVSNYFIINFKKKFTIYKEPDLTNKADLLISMLDSMITNVRKKIDKGLYEKN